VDRERRAGPTVVGDGGLGDAIRDPRGVHVNERAVDVGVEAVIEDAHEFDKEPFNAVVGVLGIPSHDAQLCALLDSEGVENAGDLDEMGAMMAMKRVDLSGDEESQQTQRAGPSNLRVKLRRE